tara:strand:+ start:1889 stop:2593 length:705 start_codon:yes stop_codon:yes gene_type:complete
MSSSQPIAVITGASSGIGESIAYKLSEYNYHIVIIARSINKLSLIKEKIKTECTAIKADLSNPKEIKRVVSKIENPQNIEVLVNNAGIGIFNKVQDTSLKDWDSQINTNLRAPFLITKAFLPYMINKNMGKIIFINSVAGLNPYPFGSAYVASKYGMRGFSSTLREEVRQNNIKVISIHPGAVDTPLWDKSDSDFNRKDMLNVKDVSEMIIQTILAPNNLVCEEITLRRTKGDF